MLGEIILGDMRLERLYLEICAWRDYTWRYALGEIIHVIGDTSNAHQPNSMLVEIYYRKKLLWTVST